MARTSDSASMAGPDSSSSAAHYSIKRVQFLGRNDVPLFCQNLNGPCPLLAVANILSLRNQLDISPNATSLSTQRLMSLVAERILDSNVGFTPAGGRGQASAFEADLRANISACMEVLGKLGTGIDVNLRFDRPNSFELTPEVVVFDLLDITLLHGWLCDPQDTEAARVLRGRSYNEVVELLITALDDTSRPLSLSPLPSGRQSGKSTPLSTPMGSLRIPVSRPSTAPSQPEPATASPGPAGVPPATASPASAPPVLDLLGDLLGDEVPGPGAPAATAAAAPPPASSAPQAASSSTSHAPPVAVEAAVDLFSGLAVQEKVQGAVPWTETHSGASPRPAMTPVGGTTNPADACLPASAVGGAASGSSGAATPAADCNRDAALRVRDAELAKEFLDRNASQLTVYGIAALSDTLRDNALAVFFRNNHFNVLFKFQHSLYLLITDQGYIREKQVVWERLDSVDGDTTLCGPDFQPYVAPASPPPAARPTDADLAALATIDPEALQGLSEADAAAIAEAAGMLPHALAHQLGQADASAADSLPPDALAAQSDADLAMALQLQEEEEAAERQRLQRQRQAAAASAQAAPPQPHAGGYQPPAYQPQHAAAQYQPQYQGQGQAGYHIPPAYQQGQHPQYQDQYQAQYARPASGGSGGHPAGMAGGRVMPGQPGSNSVRIRSQVPQAPAEDKSSCAVMQRRVA